MRRVALPACRFALAGSLVLSRASVAGAQSTPLTGKENGAKSLPLQAAPAPAPITGPVSKLPLPMVRVTLSRPVYDIALDARTGAPQMPRDVTALAQTLNWPADLPLPASFVWHVALDWDYKPFPTHHDISKTAFVHASPFTVDFGNQIRGGKLTVTAKATVNGRDISGQATAIVRGVNPSQSAILKAFPRTRFGLIASKVAMAESSLCQFTPPGKTDPGGMPNMSRTNDLGIMQLNAPTGSVTSADQIWDWRENVRRGMDELTGKQRTALQASRNALESDRLPDQTAVSLSLLNFCRGFIGLPPAKLPAPAPLSPLPGTGVLPDDPDVDHLSLSQLEREAIRRYNGGREYMFAFLPGAIMPEISWAGWQVDPTRGGISSRSGDLDYVRHVLRAHSGLTLPPPPKPQTKHADKHSSHRKSHKRHK